VSIHAGVPEEVSAFNVNMACGSGMKAVQLGAQQIALGDAEVVLAGGMENMTRVPFLLDRMRTGYGMGNATAYDAMYRDGLLDPLCGLLMGETAENLVDMYDIARGEQDEFALESQRKAISGAVARALEIVPVEAKGQSGKGTITVTQDEHPRPDTTFEGLATLAPVFREGGSVTAGNAAGITDDAVLRGQDGQLYTLIGDLEGYRLRPLAVVTPEVHVHECPRLVSDELRAHPIDVVVRAVDLDDLARLVAGHEDLVAVVSPLAPADANESALRARLETLAAYILKQCCADAPGDCGE
jgi:acetyl-CoA acetyltransferase